jgi:hypothetical protein
MMMTAAVVAGCATPGSNPGPGATGSPPSLEEAQAIAAAAARAERERFRGMTFEQFEAAVYKEPFEGGKYIVNGDTPIADRKHLREFFESQIQREPAAPPAQGGTARLIVHQAGGWTRPGTAYRSRRSLIA